MNSLSNHCTPGHCIYPYDPEIHKPCFEVLETDSEARKEAKKLWNSSDHECHPNYMNGREAYRIQTTYGNECLDLQKIWEKKAKYEPGIFSTYYNQIKKDGSEGKEMQIILTCKKGEISEFIENHPHAAHALTVGIVAAFAVFFFVTFFPNVATIALPLMGLASVIAFVKIYLDYRNVIVISWF
ncbi:MAG TPA: hypothetical protein VIH61_02255 [Waddliaceae bacterium]